MQLSTLAVKLPFICTCNDQDWLCSAYQSAVCMQVFLLVGVAMVSGKLKPDVLGIKLKQY